MEHPRVFDIVGNELFVDDDVIIANSKTNLELCKIVEITKTGKTVRVMTYKTYNCYDNDARAYSIRPKCFGRVPTALVKIIAHNQ